MVAPSPRRDPELPDVTRAIVDSIESPLRVMAGPGTGKTYAMVLRVARFLDEGVAPERILACTFTRAAADDLRRSLANHLILGANKVDALTLHSFCLRTLSRSAVLEAGGRIPRLLFEYEERFLIQDLQGDGFGGVQDKKERLLAFEAVWARMQDEEAGWATDLVDRAFERELFRWLQFHEATLVGELVPQTLRYLRENPAAQERSTFDYVLIDEYQDLNKAEQVLLDLLSDSARVTIIGDEDQSIYSFRHAHPEGISTYADSHPGTHDESLVESRRCPGRVVKMANYLISQNVRREPRQLQARPENGVGEVAVVQWDTMDQEIHGIAQFVEQRVDAGLVKPGNVLVLAPQRRLGYSIRDALAELGIPAHSFFREQLLHGDPTKAGKYDAQEAFTILKLLANPDDTPALRCWCGFGSQSLRSVGWMKLRHYCEESGHSPKEALDRLVAGSLAISGTSGIRSHYQLLCDRLLGLRNVQGRDLVNAILPAGQDWTQELRAIADQFPPDQFSAAELVEWLEGRILRHEPPTEAPFVRVMTLHKAKGLTADLVIVAGCVEGLIPHVDMTLPSKECDRVMEEQRRLFYVAITRSRQTLILSGFTHLPYEAAKRMKLPTKGRDTIGYKVQASTFLHELGPSKPIPVRGQILVPPGLVENAL